MQFGTIKKKNYFLARDPFGIKPLYYSDDGKSLRFSSQVKALKTAKNFDKAIDPAAAVGFFLNGSVPEPFSIYKTIKQLPAGCSLTLTQNKSPKIEKQLDLSQFLKRSDIYNDSLEANDVYTALKKSVADNLLSDVPIGFFLSAGIDSTALVSIASSFNSDNLHTVTLGFDCYKGQDRDETQCAELSAKQFNTKHQTIWIGKEQFSENYSKFFAAMDQPSIDGINSYFVSSAAKSAGLTVALSGLGGDEIFGSYPSFSQIPKLVNIVSKIPFSQLLGRGFRTLSYPVFKLFTSTKYSAVFEYGHDYKHAFQLRRGLYMPWELTSVLDNSMIYEGLERLEEASPTENDLNNLEFSHQKISLLELSCYTRNQLLRDTDWASMAHSLEVRVPFLDINFLKTYSNCYNSENRPTKAKFVEKFPNPPSSKILNRSKTGFTVPVREWLLEQHQEASLGRGLRGWAKLVYNNYLQQ